MKHSRVAALASLAAIALPGAGAAAQDQPQSADLAIAIKANASRVRPHHQVFFTITVTNRGPDSHTGALISLQLHNGLSHPKLVAVPPDTVVPHWTPPRCQITTRSLTCRYVKFQFAPPEQNSNSLSLVIKATAGNRTPETAVAKLGGAASDPNQADNRAAKRLRIRRG